MKPRGAYGIDAPWVPWLWTGISGASVVVSLVLVGVQAGWWSVALAWYFALAGAVYLIGAGLYWYASLRGKFVVWSGLLSRVPLIHGDRALDLGCGRGAVAIMTAERFPGVGVTGIDLWRRVDQSGNSIEIARRNAELNQMSDRVHFVTGDMMELPFPDGTFQLVTASLSIHNIPTAGGRRCALREAVRVLAPNGRIVIVDIRRVRDYADELRRAGLSVKGPVGLGWRSWWTGPWMSASSIEATQ